MALAATRISHGASCAPSSEQEALCDEKQSLLDAIESFVPSDWSAGLQTLSPQEDLVHRTHIASAHKAAIYIMVYRILRPSSREDSTNLQNWVSKIIFHVSLIPIGSPLFKSTSWPTLVAGAETDDETCYNWAEARFRQLWGALPWGYLRSALDVLESLRQRRRAKPPSDLSTVNWVQELRALDTQWLIA